MSDPKYNKRGRRIFSLAEKEEYLREYRSCVDESPKSFAERKGLRYHTFYGWVLQSRKSDPPEAKARHEAKTVRLIPQSNVSAAGLKAPATNRSESSILFKIAFGSVLQFEYRRESK